MTEDTVLQCPSCKLINPRTALKCDCGWNFVTREMVNPPKARRRIVVASVAYFVGLLASIATDLTLKLRLPERFPDVIASLGPITVLFVAVYCGLYMLSRKFEKTALFFLILLTARWVLGVCVLWLAFLVGEVT